LNDRMVMKSEMERIWKEPVVFSPKLMVQYFLLLAGVPSGLGLTPPHAVLLKKPPAPHLMTNFPTF
jgi:hypothetical protein